MCFLKVIALFFALFFYTAASAQSDTTHIMNLAKNGFRFDTDKTDSIFWYAQYVMQESEKINFTYGKILSTRLKGRYYQYMGYYDSAIVAFYDCVRQADENNLKNVHGTSLADIAAIYMETKQYPQARNTYLHLLEMLPTLEFSKRNVSQLNNNLAGAYQYLQQYDSAYYYYRMAMKMDEANNDSALLAERKSNISEILIPMGKIDLALEYLLQSKEYNERNDMVDALWYNYSNLGNVYAILKNYDASEKYYRLAYKQAEKTTTKNKVVQTLDGLSSLFQAKGQYKQALEYKLQSDSINASLINENTNKAIADLQAKYQTQKKERENIQLASKLQKRTFEKRILTVSAIGLFLLASIIGYALYQINRKQKMLLAKNKLIYEQADKLAELNFEKNSLISVVSHDLSTPMVNIQLWSDIMQKQIGDNEVLNSGVQSIKQSADYGLRLIKNILDVEKIETGHHKVALERIDLKNCLDEIENDFKRILEKKRIQMHVSVDSDNITLLADKILLKRILENLVSNAVKFSKMGTNIWLTARLQNDEISIHVKDEGPGIAVEEQKYLFEKYKRSSNLPTGNENSTGMGLFIVKRLVTELNGQVSLKSELTKGSEFILKFKQFA